MYNITTYWNGYTIDYDYQRRLSDTICRIMKNDKIIKVDSKNLWSEKEIIEYVKKEFKNLEKQLATNEDADDNGKESLHDIISDIDKHSKLEWKAKARNKTIGRSFIKYAGQKRSQHIWLCNRGYQETRITFRDITGAIGGIGSSGIVDTYSQDGTVTSKNHKQGRILAENISGHHTCYAENGRLIEFDIFDRSLYTQTQGGVYNIKIDWEERDFSFTDIQRGLAAAENYKVADLNIAIKKKQIEQVRLESEKREQEERKAEERRREELRRAESERQRKELEEKQRKEREEAERLRKLQEEEDARKLQQLENETKEFEEEKQSALEKYTHALSFIRNQATLRNNPILDKIQNDIKFSHVLDGSALIIDGGPGTGKTTTLIQRLKLLISEDALLDYRMNESTCKLTDSQIKIVSDERHNWLFFSPNALLLQYLRSNMQYEGLDGLLAKTVVWEEYLKNIIREYYMFAGTDCPFEFRRKNEPIFKNNHHLAIIRSFNGFYLRKIKELLSKVASIDVDQFSSWKRIGKEIINLCKEAENSSDLRSIIVILTKLNSLKDDSLRGHITPISTLTAQCSQNLNHLANRYIVEWKDDASLMEQLQKVVSNWQKVVMTEDADENEEEDDDDLNVTALPKNHSIEYELAAPLRSLLQKLAINVIVPGKEKITGKQGDLYAIVKDRIAQDQLKSLGESAYLKKYVANVLKGTDFLLLQRVPAIYKEFRKVAAAQGHEGWNQIVLDNVLKKHKNKVLFQQEQSLLLGFINNIILAIYGYSSSILNDDKRRNHKYVDAYKNCRIPVIGVDECTDYSVMDYYAIASLRDNRVSSITLSGDVMQCMKTDGIIDWQVLRCPEIFPDLEIGVLKTSYRQSPELMTLAEHLYQITLGHPSPYDCHISASEQTPKPLWFDSDDIEETAEWMAGRILEVHKAYGQLPSIAIFTKNADEAKALKETFDEIPSLESAGIDVYDCSGSNANLKDNDKVRIFSIDNVKGMEFDVVFFYNIDGISGNTDMINKYLYVALSRAAFFMAVSSDGSNEDISDMLKSFFVENGDWNSIIDAYKDSSVAISDSSEE